MTKRDFVIEPKAVFIMEYTATKTDFFGFYSGVYRSGLYYGVYIATGADFIMECIAVKADFTMEYTANNMDFYHAVSRQRQKRTLLWSIQRITWIFIMLYLGSDKNRFIMQCNARQ